MIETNKSHQINILNLNEGNGRSHHKLSGNISKSYTAGKMFNGHVRLAYGLEV